MGAIVNVWPDSFVYICSAGKAQVANAGPLRNAGLDRVSRVIILCGTTDPASEDANTRRDAIDPKDRLVAWLEQQSASRLSVEGGTIDVIYGDPFELQYWRKELRSHLNAFVDPQASIVFNVKGGTKEMAIGGMSATDRHERRSIVTVRVNPNMVERIDSDTPGPLPATGGYLSFTEYLSLYGFRLESGTKGKGLRRERDWITDFCRSVAESVGSVPLILNRMIRAFFSNQNKRSFEPKIISADWGVIYADDWNRIQSAFQAMDGHLGFKVERNADGIPQCYRIEQYSAVAFLQGGWLEAQLFLALDTAFAERNDVELRANVCLFDRTGGKRITEIDVAVMIRGQLHILEAKTGTMESAVGTENAERSLAQIATNKADLLGQMGGYAFVVNPTIDAVPEVVEQRARSTGIGLILGASAVEEAVRKVRALLDAR